jgi:quinol monooxygenase YgiN
MLAHSVLFKLKDNAPCARQELIAACKRYLSGHEGIVFFAVGQRAEDIDWSVSDRDFDVALHIVFRDRASHDAYQDSPEHTTFLEKYEGNWQRIRAIDAYVPG